MRCFCRTWRRTGVIGIFFTTVALLMRLTSMLFNPLWLDAFLPDPGVTNSSLLNTSDPLHLTNSTSMIRQSNPYFQILMQALVPVVVWSLVLLCILIFFPSRITDRERKFPKHLIVIPGVGQSMCGIFLNYASSGARTPPYLQAVLNNFVIPIQFVVRFVILRKRPTLLKLLCAVAVIVAEFVCMLPTIFPGLESEAQHEDDGGASGAGAVLWPLCFTSAMIPLSIGNAVMEAGVKKGQNSKAEGQVPGANQLNIAYYLFWYSWTMLAVYAAFFWVDILPGFGYSANIQVFGETMWFNLQCLFGGAECPGYVSGLGWAIILANLIAFPAVAFMLRYMEGANFMVIAMSLRSPIVLLFWTLFEEHPFYWHPHPHLATWLSVAALCVMIPAIIIYNISTPEIAYRKPMTTLSIQQQDDGEPLLNGDVTDRNLHREETHTKS